MRKIIGIGCMILGVLCLMASVGILIYNGFEAKKGEEFSQALLQDVQKEMEQYERILPQDKPAVELQEESGKIQKMETVPAGEYESVGILSIPVLELELPVLADWSYEKLKKSPCHYYGSCYEPDFVIAAHNYTAHFGNLSMMQPGDLVVFTDVRGTKHCYEVVLLETLAATATEEMITSGFDLSLYTCTPGGSNRVTVRCKALIAP